MANIAITAYCNLKCPYCFADDMICEQSHNITIEKFREILQWIARGPENHIGIIGGEPTIHPLFSDILKEVNTYCRELQTSATLFTNGIYLDKYLSEIGNSTGILINCNGPDTMTADQWTKFNATLEHLHLLDWFHPGQERANIGCNIYMARTDYTFIWQIIDKYNIKRLRTSVTSPTPEFRGGKEEYFTKLKPIFMDFVEKALERQIVLGMDCSQIPNCYFTEEEMEKVLKVMPEKCNPNYCEPVIDITPEFTATACFGCYDPVDCTQFPTLMDLRRYMLHRKNYPRMVANATGKCATCKNHELMLCQGGCLGFANMDNVKLIQSVVDDINTGKTEKAAATAQKIVQLGGVQPALSYVDVEPKEEAPTATTTGGCTHDCNSCASHCGNYGMYTPNVDNRADLAAAPETTKEAAPAPVPIQHAPTCGCESCATPVTAPDEACGSCCGEAQPVYATAPVEISEPVPAPAPAVYYDNSSTENSFARTSMMMSPAPETTEEGGDLQ